MFTLYKKGVSIMFSIFGKKKSKAATAPVAYARPSREPSAPLLGNPSFIWRGDRDYPEITVSRDHIAGLAEWLMKILEKSQPTGANDEPWNALVADIWPNDQSCRLIGHVQLEDKSIGWDTGFRVCAYLSGGGIVGGNEDDEADIPLINSWLNAAVASEPLRSQLSQRAEQNPFKIRLSLEGMGPLHDVIEIKFR